MAKITVKVLKNYTSVYAHEEANAYDMQRAESMRLRRSITGEKCNCINKCYCDDRRWPNVGESGY